MFLVIPKKNDIQTYNSPTVVNHTNYHHHLVNLFYYISHVIYHFLYDGHALKKKKKKNLFFWAVASSLGCCKIRGLTEVD